jgi:hypothetical protein
VEAHALYQQGALETAVPLTNCLLILLDLDTGRLENRIVLAVPV